VVGFCQRITEDTLNAAEKVVQKVAEPPAESCLAINLVRKCRALFNLCSPPPQIHPGIEFWDHGTFELKKSGPPFVRLLTAGEYEGMVRARLQEPGVLESVRRLLEFEREGLLSNIEDEFRRLAGTEPSRNAVTPDVGVGENPSIERDLARPADALPGLIESLGNCRYRVGDEVLILTESEDCVLQAFLSVPGNTHRKDTLAEAAGMEESACMRVLRELKGTDKHTAKYGGLFSPYIKRPGKKGKGGYKVDIRSNT
jgi:hypothetical protein